MERKRELNGANLIVEDGQGRILVHKERTRKNLWMLPGGGVERGEMPEHAAQSETEEETGIITDAATYRDVGWFVQKPSGVVFLFATNRYEGELITEPNDESEDACFLSLNEIVRRQEEFRTSTLRMILRWQRCLHGIDKMPYHGRLSDVVDYPANLDLAQYKSSVLRV